MCLDTSQTWYHTRFDLLDSKLTERDTSTFFDLVVFVVSSFVPMPFKAMPDFVTNLGHVSNTPSVNYAHAIVVL